VSLDVAEQATPRQGSFAARLSQSRFLAKYPYYAGVVARMEPVLTTAVPSMAVALRRMDKPDARVLLLMNPDYFAIYPEYFSGVLLHEIRHVLCGHLSDELFHRVSYRRAMEVAMEITANEGIDEPLPSDGFVIEAYSKFGVRPGQSTLERYVCLRTALESGQLKMQDLWGASMMDSHRPRQSGQRCAGLGDVLDSRSDGASDRNWSQNGWGLSAPSSQDTIDEMRRSIAQHLQGERGGSDDLLRDFEQPRLAKELQRVVRLGATVTRMDWPTILQQAFPRRRLVVADYLRPNRRFVDRVGEIPGRRRRPPMRSLLVAIDTSGSMNGETLDRVSSQIRQLARYARLTILECDAAVHRIYPLSAQLHTMIGGGDTDFGPVFDEAQRHRNVDGLIYFTDGKGVMPVQPPAIATLWVLTSDDAFSSSFGAQRQMS
jgi:predicted metal-dependent peptidase